MTALASESVIQPYAYQKLMAAQRSRYAIFRWSRQAGKSMGVALLVNLDILEVEATGKRTLWTVISRSLAQAREQALKIRDVGRAVMMARNLLKGIEQSETRDALGETQLELTYPNGSRVIVVSGNPDAAAGYTGNVAWDEVGLTKRAAELFGTSFPVVSRGGYRYIMTSTPRPGFWKKKWDEAQKAGSPWYSHTLTIHDAIAQGCPMDAAELRAGLNDELRWKQEYLCEDVDDEVCWLPWEMILAATDANRCTMAVPGELDDGAAFAGWDVARWQHLSVLWIAQKYGPLLVTRGVLAMQRMPFESQITLVSDTLKRFAKFTRVCVDATGMGEMVAEQLGKRLPGRVEAVKFTGGVKEVIAGDLRRVMEERSFLLPDDEAVRTDLHSVQRTVTAAGNFRFEGEAEGSHADRFWCAGLCVHGAIKPGGALSSLPKLSLPKRELAMGSW